MRYLCATIRKTIIKDRNRDVGTFSIYRPDTQKAIPMEVCRLVLFHSNLECRCSVPAGVTESFRLGIRTSRKESIRFRNRITDLFSAVVLIGPKSFNRNHSNNVHLVDPNQYSILSTYSWAKYRYLLLSSIDREYLGRQFFYYYIVVFLTILHTNMQFNKCIPI